MCEQCRANTSDRKDGQRHKELYAGKDDENFIRNPEFWNAS
ncbi:hypothetical protein [Shewanella sp. 1CM18E]|nr:hypothetical protein [Shewanella sp. 1CM18E]